MDTHGQSQSPRSPSQDERREQRHRAHRTATFQAFIKDLCSEGGLDQELASAAAASVLRVLETRILQDEAHHLEAQLPMAVREALGGAADEPFLDKFGRDDLLDRVGTELGMPKEDAEPIVRAVLATLARHVTAGEIDKVVQQLPADIRRLWPDDVQARVAARMAERAQASGPH